VSDRKYANLVGELGEHHRIRKASKDETTSIEMLGNVRREWPSSSKVIDVVIAAGAWIR
jgi:hypothetical protein